VDNINCNALQFLDIKLSEFYLSHQMRTDCLMHQLSSMSSYRHSYSQWRNYIVGVWRQDNACLPSSPSHF